MKHWLLAAVCGLYLVGQSNRGLWLPDEPRDAGIAWEMSHTRDWVLPCLNGEPFLEKPPLSYAAAALSLGTWPGSPETAVRIPSALFCLGTLALTFWMGRRLLGEGAGMLAASLLGTSWEFMNLGHTCIVDTGLVFWVSLAMASALGERWLLCGAALGLAFLSKGPIGILLPGAGLGVHLLLKRQWGALPRIAVPCILLAGLWLLALDGVGQLQPYWDEQIRRVGPGVEHAKPPYYYLYKMFEDFAPWSLLIPFLGAWLWRRRPAGLLLPLAWFLGALVLLSVPASKRGLYLVPAFPGLALLLAAMLKEWDGGRRILPIALGGAVLAWSCILSLYWPRVVEAEKNVCAPVLALARSLPGAEIAGMGLSEPVRGGLSFSFGRRIPTLKDAEALKGWLAPGRLAWALVQGEEGAPPPEGPWVPVFRLELRHESLHGLATPEAAVMLARP